MPCVKIDDTMIAVIAKKLTKITKGKSEIEKKSTLDFAWQLRITADF